MGRLSWVIWVANEIIRVLYNGTTFPTIFMERCCWPWRCVLHTWPCGSHMVHGLGHKPRECGWLLESGKNKEMYFPLEFLQGSTNLLNFGLSLCWDFWRTDLWDKLMLFQTTMFYGDLSQQYRKLIQFLYQREREKDRKTLCLDWKNSSWVWRKHEAVRTERA